MIAGAPVYTAACPEQTGIPVLPGSRATPLGGGYEIESNVRDRLLFPWIGSRPERDRRRTATQCRRGAELPAAGARPRGDGYGDPGRHRGWSQMEARVARTRQRRRPRGRPRRRHLFRTGTARYGWPARREGQFFHLRPGYPWHGSPWHRLNGPPHWRGEDLLGSRRTS